MLKAVVLARRVFFGVFLALVIFGAIAFANNVLGATFQGWQIENGGGQYSENSGVITLSGAGGKHLILYEQIEPTADFSFSLQVNAANLVGFAIMLRSSLPFAGSTQGINFQFGSPNSGSFCLARYVNGWTWNYFTTGNQQNVWYTMKLNVRANPFEITTQAYDQNGVLIGTYSASDMTNLAFEDINYLGFGVLESGGNYTVRNIQHSNLSIIEPTPSPSPESPDQSENQNLSQTTLYQIVIAILIIAVGVALILIGLMFRKRH